LRILLAEDNAINRELTTRILSKRGHSVTAAENGKLALDVLEAQAFDLVLMDVQMPEMDGFDATAAIRKREASSGTHIPIIAMTAHAMKGDRERCLQAGMDAYISKPVQSEELLKLVEALGVAATATSPDASSTPVNESTGEVLDRAVALARVDGDETLLADLARLLLEESPKMLAAVQAAVSEGDARRLERAAHSLKGAVSTFAAHAAVEAAVRLERLGRAGDLAEAPQACAALEAQIEKLRTALQSLTAPTEPVPGR
jgi:CheY-like chemotaxis protein/HPt (histidine-containing phosphotransfer) domain-containing protein